MAGREDAADAADTLERLVARLGLPGRLSDLGVQASDYPKIAEVAVKSVFARSNPRPLAKPQDVVDLLQRHGESQRRVAVDRGLVFEIAQAAGRQHDALEREVLGERESRKREKAQQGDDGKKAVHELSPGDAREP